MSRSHTINTINSIIISSDRDTSGFSGVEFFLKLDSFEFLLPGSVFLGTTWRCCCTVIPPPTDSYKKLKACGARRGRLTHFMGFYWKNWRFDKKNGSKLNNWTTMGYILRNEGVTTSNEWDVTGLFFSGIGNKHCTSQNRHQTSEIWAN